MRKITFLSFLMACGFAQAQTYCSINPDYEGVEEITSVVFGTTSISNTNTTSILIDRTTTIANVTKGQSYTLTVKGNTVGNFDNEYVAFIDWNHNGTLNETGEVFYIGLITDSDGTDAKSATVSIPVPNTATNGNTRIRITKTYTDQSDDYVLNRDPCYISIEDVFFGSPGDIAGSFGQALDFTLNVTALGTASFSNDLFTMYPNPAKDILNLQGDLAIEEINIYNLQGQLVLANKNDNQINVAGLPTGQYMIKAASGGLFQTGKFVKQ